MLVVFGETQTAHNFWVVFFGKYGILYFIGSKMGSCFAKNKLYVNGGKEDEAYQDN